MNNIQAPFIEYNFYFHKNNNENNFNKIVEAFEEIENKKKNISLLPISKDAELRGDNNPIGVDVRHRFFISCNRQ